MNRLSWNSLKETPEYKAYHAECVEACVELMGEQCRDFFDNQCSYEVEFYDDAPPSEVADSNRDAFLD